MQLISETGTYPSDDAYEEALKTVAQWVVNAAVRDQGDGGRDTSMVLEDYLADTYQSLTDYVEGYASDVDDGGPSSSNVRGALQR